MLMFALLQKRQLLDEGSRQWLYETFAWALRNFDAEIFRKQTILLLMA